jgi:hypothetical protein
VDALPSEMAAPSAPKKRTTRLKSDASSVADPNTDDVPPDPKRRITMLKEDSTDQEGINMSSGDTPIVPRRTLVKPAEDETGLMQEANLPDGNDPTPASSPTPAVIRFPIEEEDQRATTRPSPPLADSDEDDEDKSP